MAKRARSDFYELTIVVGVDDIPVMVRLKRLLKEMLRSYGLRCLSIERSRKETMFRFVLIADETKGDATCVRLTAFVKEALRDYGFAYKSSQATTDPHAKKK